MSLQITITQVKSAVLIFLQSGVENCLYGWGLHLESLTLIPSLVVMGSGWVGLGQPPLGLENLPLKSQIFIFFSFRVKKSHQFGSKNNSVKARSATFLLPVKNMHGTFQYNPTQP